MEYTPPVSLLGPADKKRLGESIREVFPELTEKQLAEVINVAGSDVDRCLQHILDHPHRFLVRDDPPPPPPKAPVADGPRRMPDDDHKTLTQAASNSTSRETAEKQNEERSEGKGKEAYGKRSTGGMKRGPHEDEAEEGHSQHETLSSAHAERKRREFSDLNNVFADIFSGAQTGEVIFQGSFRGTKGKGSSQADHGEGGAQDGEEDTDTDTDLVLARALQAIEDDAYRAIKRMEEEDERMARELERRDREGGDGRTRDPDHDLHDADVRLARELAAAERPTLSTTITTEPEPASAGVKGRRERRLLISSQESQEEEREGKEGDGWRKLVRQDSLTERDRRLALQLFKEEKERELAKRKREEEDEALAKSLQSGDGDGGTSTGEPSTAKRRRVSDGETDVTTDEAIVRLLQEEEEEEHRREREKKAREEEEMSRKLIEKLMRQEDKEHNEWVLSEMAKIDAREKGEYAYGGTAKKKKTKGGKWPGFGFGWGDKERMREKMAGKVVGDSDWKSSRFFADTSVLEGFLRSCARSSGTVTITNVMKYDLVERFERKWAEFKARYRHSAETQTILGFHGTRGDLIPSITAKGLLVPGTAPGVEHVTDSGWYGRGIYLSPNPEVAQGYASDGKLLVCSVLMGRIYHCPDMMEGADCEHGYDSHMSPCEQELILFDAAQVLPCYLVHWKE